MSDLKRGIGEMPGDGILDDCIIYNVLDIPFKDFTPGQIIQSKQFNDDMLEIEEKINEIIQKYSHLRNHCSNHFGDMNNPHSVTPSQIGTYSEQEIDAYVDDLKNGNFNNGVIVNEVLADGCVHSRNLLDGSITASKVDDSLGAQIDISNNIEITDRYTKRETDELLRSKVGDGTYTKEELDDRFQQVQAGQIVDKSVGANQLKDDVGNKIDLSGNESLLNRYTKNEVDILISANGMSKDWGDLSDVYEPLQISHISDITSIKGVEFYIPYITNKPIVEHWVSWDGGSVFYNKTNDVTSMNNINMFKHDNQAPIGKIKMAIKVVCEDGQTIISNVFTLSIVSNV